MKVLVLGSNGMLGSVVTEYLTSLGHDVFSTSRGITKSQSPRVLEFDVIKNDFSGLKFDENRYDYIINCIGLIKSLISHTPEDRELAIRVNSLFPIGLHSAIRDSNTRIIQIGTDCVYSGAAGNYSEESVLDPVDIYGYSKALGEFSSKNQMLLRCSIVGREKKSHTSLMDWTLRQPQNSTINGYKNHIWNGLTTLTFAKIVHGIMVKDLFSPETIHIVPDGVLSKFELVSLFVKHFDRDDIKINASQTAPGVNRTLSSLKHKYLLDIWKAAGYQHVPSHNQMILEYAEYLNLNLRIEE